MRLIDADELIKYLVKMDEQDEVIEYVEQSPTVEPKQGEWIQQYKNDGGWHDMGYFNNMYKCSNCGSNGTNRFNFCPNCGAKMEVQDDT